MPAYIADMECLGIIPCTFYLLYLYILVMLSDIRAQYSLYKSGRGFRDGTYPETSQH